MEYGLEDVIQQIAQPLGGWNKDPGWYCGNNTTHTGLKWVSDTGWE